MTNQISFKAQFIRPATITKYSAVRDYKPMRASFIELKPKTTADRTALRGAESLWGEGDTFAAGIANDFEDEIFWTNTNKKYYALTLQKNHLDTPVATKILGLAEVLTGDNRIKLKYLQTDPQHKHNSPNQKFKGIGTAMLDAIKTIFPQADIVLEPAESAVDFYLENGFKRINNNTSMIFKR
ncbi:MAG: hypothetical protein NC408_02455 [Candidatus Gastranaerophilales bacterium]|nr:hypothetical protein [Candidatus Gastranaerophilales bacterium]MCM1073885.1 hypothetical protein [Bacteroides sp.]